MKTMTINIFKGCRTLITPLRMLVNKERDLVKEEKSFRLYRVVVELNHGS